MRAIWKGTLTFGLITIPAKLYSATESQKLDFEFLHKDDLKPIQYLRVCKSDGKEIPFDEIVRGYRVEPGDYVVMKEEDFKRAEAENAGGIDVLHFARPEEIDPIHYEKSYYLAPGRGGEKAYVLLRDALRQAGRVGIATFVMRHRKYLAALSAHDDALIVHRLRYASEILKPSDVGAPDGISKAAEREMVVALVEGLTRPFDPARYKDTYVEELRKIIAQKRQGKLPAPKRPKQRKLTKGNELLNLLEASLEHQPDWEETTVR